MPSAGDRKWTVVLSDAFYRRLLVLYPKAFRAAYGAEMAQVFRDRVRQAYRAHGAIGVLALWPAALRDLMASAMAERLVEERQMFRRVLTLATGLLVIGAILVNSVHGYNLLEGIVIVFDGVVFLPVFNLLIVVYGLVHSFPLAVVLVTLAFQLCLLPLTLKLLRDARALRALQPELRHLREEYRDDPAAWQAARRTLYRPHGITAGGVPLWLVLQSIFLYALYGAFLTVLPRGAGGARGEAAQVELAQDQVAHINSRLYPFVPHVSALPNMHFLWTNLVAADPLYILPALSVLLTVFVVYLLQRRRAAAGFTGPFWLLATIGLTLGSVWGFPTGSAGIALSVCVSMLFTVAGYVALAGHAPDGEGPRDHRLTAGNSG